MHIFFVVRPFCAHAHTHPLHIFILGSVRVSVCVFVFENGHCEYSISTSLNSTSYTYIYEYTGVDVLESRWSVFSLYPAVCLVFVVCSLFTGISTANIRRDIVSFSRIIS